MATIVEDMDTGVAAAAAGSQPTAPVVLDDASLNRLADLLQARMQPTRPAWQTSMLVALAGALIAAATAGYFSLRGDIAAGNTSLRAELQEFRAEFNRVTLDHTERLTRVETVQAHHTEQLAQHTEQLADHTERLTRIEAVQAQHTEQLADHTERLARIEAAHPHPAAP